MDSETTLRCMSASTFSSSSTPVSNNLGTGFGESKRSEVVSVNFDRLEGADSIFEIYYNTREQLEKIGINFKAPVYVTPNAFPGENGYCQPPQN